MQPKGGRVKTCIEVKLGPIKSRLSHPQVGIIWMGFFLLFGIVVSSQLYFFLNKITRRPRIGGFVSEQLKSYKYILIIIL